MVYKIRLYFSLFHGLKGSFSFLATLCPCIRSGRFAAFLLAGVLVLTSSLLHAEEVRYVQPNCEVMLRRGQGTEFKILEVLADGTKVELLEEAELWARVRSESGREGWLPRRFLSAVQPVKNRLDELQKQSQELQTQNQELSQRLAEVEEQHSGLQERLKTCMGERDKALADYARLEKKAAMIQQSEEEQKKWKEEQLQLRSRVSDLEKENDALRKNSSLRWFLAGSGVLLVGWLLGLLSSKGRRRKSSLL